MPAPDSRAADPDQAAIPDQAKALAFRSVGRACYRVRAMNWKGHLLEFVTFLLLPCLGALAAWFAFRTDRFDRWDGKRWFRLAAALFLLTRVGTHVVVFHVFRYPGGDDLTRVWEPIARAVLEGRDPAPYVENLYGPIFPLVLAAGYALSGGSYVPSIGAPFLLADALSLVLLLRIARRRFPEALARRITLAVLASPVLWHGLIVRTQEEPLFALFLLWTVDLLDRKREGPAVFAAAFGTFCTKALFPLWVLPVLLAAGGGWRRVTARTALAGGLTLLGMGLYVGFGGGIRERFGPALAMFGSSPWTIFAGGSWDEPPVFRLGLALTAAGCCAAAFGAALRPGRFPDLAARGVVAVQAAFLVLSPFSIPLYLAMGLPFLAWQAAEEGGAAGPVLSRGSLLVAAFALWQIPSCYLGAEHWMSRPWLVAPFALTWAWTGWLALRAPDSRDS